MRLSRQIFGAGVFFLLSGLCARALLQAETAVYNPSLRAPQCSSMTSPRQAPATLINSRDGIGPEPNQLNTVLASLYLDGAGGLYHSSESLDSFDVADPKGQFMPGDADGDGMPDTWENTYSACMKVATPDANDDYDGDGIRNLDEYSFGTDPCTADLDTDHDGLPDAVETNTGIYLSPADTGTDPYNPDTDGDLLQDGDEVLLYNTDPNLEDTDAGGAGDGAELLVDFTDPLNPTDDLSPSGPPQPGANYFWDLDGDHRATVVDILLLEKALDGNTLGYANVVPKTLTLMDLNGDGAVTSDDLNLLQDLVAGDLGGKGGEPTAIQNTAIPGSALIPGGAAQLIEITLKDTHGTPRNGAGLIFEKTGATGGITNAQVIFGGTYAHDATSFIDPATQNYYGAGAVFAVTGEPDADGKAKVTVRIAEGAPNGSVTIRAWLPGTPDTLAKGLSAVTGAEFTLAVQNTTVTVLDLNPDEPVSVNKSSSLQFQTISTFSKSSTIVRSGEGETITCAIMQTSATANNLYPMLKNTTGTDQDTTGDNTNGIADLRYEEDTFITDAGAYQLDIGTTTTTRDRMDVTSFNVSAIPNDAVITGVSIQVSCGRSSPAPAGAAPTNPLVQTSIDDGGTYQNVANTHCYSHGIAGTYDTLPTAGAAIITAPTGGWTKTGVQDLRVKYDTDGAGYPGGPGRYIAFDWVWLSVTWTQGAPVPLTSINEGQQKSFSALITWAEGGTSKADLIPLNGGCTVTDGAGGTGTITGGQVPCGGGICEVQCVAEVGATVDGTVNIPVNNVFEAVTTVDVTPNGTVTLAEGGSQGFNAKATFSDGCSEQVACGGSLGATTWQLTGPLAAGTCAGNLKTITANQIPCGAGGSGTVKATYNAVSDPTATGVIVTNNDSVTAVNVTPNSTVTLAEGASQNFRAVATYNDGCTEPVSCGGPLGATSWTLTGDLTLGTCAANLRTVTANQIPCAPGGAGAVNATYSAISDAMATAVTVTNNDSVTTVDVTPDSTVSLAEGATVNFKAKATFSDACTEQVACGGLLGATIWTLTGPLTLGGCASNQQTVTADSIPCHSGGQGSVAASYSGKSDASQVETFGNNVLSSVDVTPDGTVTLAEGASQIFQAVATFMDGCTQQVACGGPLGATTWQLTGNLTLGTCAVNVRTVNANQIPCGAGGSGAVNATYSTVSDATAAAVSVTNDDVVVSTMLSCPPSALEGAMFSCTTTRTWSDLCTENLTAGESSSGDCTGSAGSYIAGEIPCGAGGSCSISDAQADNNPQTMTIINNDVVTTVDVTPDGTVTLAEGASMAFKALATFSDGCTEPVACGGLLGATIWTLTGDLTPGACAANLQTVNADQIPCGAGGSGTVNATYNGVSDPAPSGMTVTNDDTLSSVDLTPNGPLSVPQSGTQNFYCVGAWSDGCTNSEANPRGTTPAYTLPANGSGGSINSFSGLYTAGSTEPSTDVARCTISGLGDSTTVSVTSGGAKHIYLTIPPGQLDSGQEFWVSVYASSQTTTLGEYTLTLRFDPTFLEFVTLPAPVAGTSDFEDPWYQTVSNDKLKIWAKNHNLGNCTTAGNIHLADVLFRLRWDAPLGLSTQLALVNSSDTTVYQIDNCSSVDVTSQFGAEGVMVETHQPCTTYGSDQFMDCNGDGVINYQDVIMAQDLVQGKKVNTVGACFTNVGGLQCDINGNGYIDENDVGFLKSFIRPNLLFSGQNGVCETTASGDDVQEIAPGHSSDCAICVTAGGAQLDPETSLLGDDTIYQGVKVTSGEDGICQTYAASGDVQTTPVGEGCFGAICVSAGDNGTIDSTPEGDDHVLDMSLNLAQLCSCVAAGGASLVTTPSGDDELEAAEGIIVPGSDGVCNTTAVPPDIQATPKGKAAITVPGSPKSIALVSPTDNPYSVNVYAEDRVSITVKIQDENGMPRCGISPKFEVVSGDAIFENTYSALVEGIPSCSGVGVQNRPTGEVTVSLIPGALPSTIKVSLPTAFGKCVGAVPPLFFSINPITSQPSPDYLCATASQSGQTDLGQDISVDIYLAGHLSEGGTVGIVGRAKYLQTLTSRNFNAGSAFGTAGRQTGDMAFHDGFENNFTWTVPTQQQSYVNRVNVANGGTYGFFQGQYVVRAAVGSLGLYPLYMKKTITGLGAYDNLMIGFHAHGGSTRGGWIEIQGSSDSTCSNDESFSPISPRFWIPPSTVGSVSPPDPVPLPQLAAGTTFNQACLRIAFYPDTGGVGVIDLDDIYIFGKKALFKATFDALTVGQYPSSFDTPSYQGAYANVVVASNPSGGKMVKFTRTQAGAVDSYTLEKRLDLGNLQDATLSFEVKDGGLFNGGYLEPWHSFSVQVNDSGGYGQWIEIWRMDWQPTDWTYVEIPLSWDSRYSLVGDPNVAGDEFRIRWVATMDSTESGGDPDAVYLDNVELTGIPTTQDDFQTMVDLGNGHYSTTIKTFDPTYAAGTTHQQATQIFATYDDPNGYGPGQSLYLDSTLSCPAPALSFVPRKVVMDPSGLTGMPSPYVYPPDFTVKACQKTQLFVFGRYQDTPLWQWEDLTKLFTFQVSGPATITGDGWLQADCFKAADSLAITVNAVPRYSGINDPGGSGGGQQTGYLSGKVFHTYPPYAAVPNSQVHVSGNSQHFSALTLSDGSYSFQDVPVYSSYTLKTTKVLYKGKTETGIAVNANQTTTKNVYQATGSDTDGDTINDSSDTDDDDDGVADGSDTGGGLSPTNPDSDGDGYLDGEDVFPTNAGEWADNDGDGTGDNSDTDDDNDGLSDTEETTPGVDGYVTNPLNPDSDGDMLCDGETTVYWGVTLKCYKGEKNNALNPNNADTDGDNVSDYIEVKVKSCMNPKSTDTDGDGLADGTEDADHDGVLDAGETDPCLADTDGDGVSDYVEKVTKTCMNARSTDTDGDGVPDGTEDADHDGVLDAAVTGETDPCLSDTDSDGLPDGWERTYSSCGVDPRVSDATADPDGDGLTNAQEYALGTNPCSADTDNDMIPDGFEHSHSCLSPTVANERSDDYDGDGLGDVDEYFDGTDPCNNAEPKLGRQGKGFFGDADGSLSVGGPDLDQVALILSGNSPSYASVYPPDQMVQDLDGSGSIGGPDLDYIQLMLSGNIISPFGWPTDLSRLEPGGTVDVTVGNTVAITVSLTSLGLERAGFGVVFSVESGSAVLYGGEGWATGYASGARYDLTNLSGEARMVVKVIGTGYITVKVELPASIPETDMMDCPEVTLLPDVTIHGVSP